MIAETWTKKVGFRIYPSWDENQFADMMPVSIHIGKFYCKGHVPQEEYDFHYESSYAQLIVKLDTSARMGTRTDKKWVLYGIVLVDEGCSGIFSICG